MRDELAKRYPRTVDHNGNRFEIRSMRADDEAAVLAFTRSLPEHDLLFLRRDIREPKVINAWVRDLEVGNLTSLLALHDEAIVGCSAVVVDPLSFSPHVGELRVMLSPSERTVGLGRILIQESFLVALMLELKKLTARMTSDQTSAIKVFEDMGFRPEAALRNQVQNQSGEFSDLIIMSHDVEAVLAKMELYGLTDALGGEGE